MINFTLYFILGAALRRWYGGAFDDGKHPVLGNRALQTVVMILTFVSIYVTNYKNWQCWLFALVVSCWLQFQFWSRGHGCCFDLGRDEEPSESAIKRYNERWYHYVCDWFLPSHKYGFLYDFTYMILRYACPMLLLAILDARYVLIGLVVSPVYAFCWTLQDRESWMFDGNPEWLNKGTKLAELIVGGVVYSGCYLLKWGL